jgi:hypothetical protein
LRGRGQGNKQAKRKLLMRCNMGPGRRCKRWNSAPVGSLARPCLRHAASVCRCAGRAHQGRSCSYLGDHGAGLLAWPSPSSALRVPGPAAPPTETPPSLPPRSHCHHHCHHYCHHHRRLPTLTNSTSDDIEPFMVTLTAHPEDALVALQGLTSLWGLTHDPSHRGPLQVCDQLLLAVPPLHACDTL